MVLLWRRCGGLASFWVMICLGGWWGTVIDKRSGSPLLLPFSVEVLVIAARGRHFHRSDRIPFPPRSH
jgi:hypothetical protein